MANGDRAKQREAEEYLSGLLQRYASCKGIAVNTENYRNQSGMYMQLTGFDNLVKDQIQFGRSSRLMDEVYTIYQKEPEKYRRMLEKVYEELGIEKI